MNELLTSWQGVLIAFLILLVIIETVTLIWLDVLVLRTCEADEQARMVVMGCVQGMTCLIPGSIGFGYGLRLLGLEAGIVMCLFNLSIMLAYWNLHQYSHPDGSFELVFAMMILAILLTQTGVASAKIWEKAQAIRNSAETFINASRGRHHH